MDNAITLYRPKDIQNIFACSKDKAYKIMNTTGFPSFRIDGSIYVERIAFEQWLTKQRGKTVLT